MRGKSASNVQSANLNTKVTEPDRHSAGIEAESFPFTTRAERLLRTLENAWLYLDRLVQKFIPPSLNPLGQLGAMANTSLIIAVLSGVALLIWYSPSVHHAYESLETIRRSSWLGQLVRSIHRYSSDGCLFFVLLHACRIVCQRRFTGPRWLAWVTGLGLLSLLWFIGWTGYWLVWDVRGQHAALGTARFIDRLPIFAEPLSRSFLTDQSMPSLLFFVIFFVHMLAPLAVGIGIWMHLMRVNRSRFLASRTMTLWLAGSLIALSALLPAVSASPAAMTVKAQKFSIDWWYLWPFALTDRLGGGALWGLFLFTGIAALTVPWWMAKRRRAPEWKAHVELPRCIGCSLCAQDCPFNAITMVPREDGRKFPVQSHVNPDLCVGCGICTGACDSQAINLPALNSREVERRLHAWIDGQQARGVKPFVAFCCAESTESSLRHARQSSAGFQPAVSPICTRQALDSGSASENAETTQAGSTAIQQTGSLHYDRASAELPGYFVQTVPCVGWVSAGMLEGLLQRGAEGVLVVGCGETDPIGREGMKWFSLRMAGRREPAFNTGKADPERVRFVKIARTRPGDLLKAARDFQERAGRATLASARRGEASATSSPLSDSRRGEDTAALPARVSSIRRYAPPFVATVVLISVLAAVTFAFSNLPYRTPHSSQPELIVSFNHSGALLEARKLTKEELAKRLPHMRAQVNVSRERAPVRLRVQVDGQTVFDRSFQPKGLSKDGPSIAIARLPVTAGRHEVRVDLADTGNPDAWTREWSEAVEFHESRNRVVLFDTKAGFSLH